MPECYFVEKISPGQGPEETPSVFASMMFHGQALRPEAEFPLQVVQYNDHVLPFLRMGRNFSRPGELVVPVGTWVVSERLKNELSAVLERVTFVEVVWGKIFDFQYGLAEEPFSYPTRVDAVYEKFEHEPALLGRVGRWFEVLVPNYRQVNERWAEERTEYAVPSVNRSKPREIALSAELVEAEGLFTYYGHYLSARVMNIMADAINEDFFDVKAIQIG